MQIGDRIKAIRKEKGITQTDLAIKVKYVDTKTQRAYWLDAELLKIFEKEYPKKKYDRSQIIEDLLRKFLADNGKI